MIRRSLLLALFVLLALTPVYAQEEAAKEEGATAATEAPGLAFLGVALAIGIPAIAAGYAIGHAGSAAMGAIAEKPEVATWGLIIVALAEGIALYGLVIAFMLLGQL